MSRREPEDVDAAFAQIVADLEREGVGRSVPDVPDEDPEPVAVVERDPAPAWRGHETEIDWNDDNVDERYVPPEPPPLPKLRPLTVLALAMLVVGVLLLVLPALVGMSTRIGTPIGLAALACGLALLLLRARKTPRTDPDDDGAQV